MAVKIHWNKPPAQISERIMNRSTKLFAAATWHKLYTPFVPMGDTGQLAFNVNYLEEGQMGVVHHLAPYAHRQYEGTGFHFRKDKHPLASHHWDKAAKAAGKSKDLEKSLQLYLKGR